MKVILINPPIDPEKALGKLKDISHTFPTIGLAYLAAVLEKNGIEVKVIDAYAYNFSIKQTINNVKRESPAVVGISCLTPVAPIVHKLAEEIKKIDKGIVVILGNIHPTLLPNETLLDKHVDIIVRGEGEITFLELVQNLLINESELSNVKGISYRIGEKIIHNQDRDLIKDLDSLPYPSWHLFPLERYDFAPHWLIKTPAFAMLASRGCPYKCTFCSLKVMGKGYRMRTPKNIVDEIDYLIDNYDAKQIMFMDSTFPLNKKWGMSVCDEMIKRGINKEILWVCETRVNHVDLELLKRMKSAGCRRVAYGIESGVQQLLDNVNKGFTLDQVRNVIKMTKKANLEIIAFFMIGLPGETIELSQQTINFAKELDPDFAKFNITTPYPGTKLYNDAIEDGTLKSSDWDRFISNISMTSYEPVYVPKNMTKEELYLIQRKASRDFYLRPKCLVKYVKKIRSFDDIQRYTKTFWVMCKALRN